MSSASILLFAGIVLFVLSLGLFRLRPNRGAAVGSVWKHGSVSGRIALLLWWASLVLLLASAAMNLLGH